MITRVSGVVLDDTDLQNVAAALDELIRLRGERRNDNGQATPMPLSPRLVEALAVKLARAARNASPHASGPDQAEPTQPPVAELAPRAQSSTGVHDSGHAPIGATAAAARLHITANGVRDLARRGRIRAHRNGTRWEFDPADVDTFAAQRRPG